MFFYPWLPALMLAIESGNVINYRLAKMARGGPSAAAEAKMMIGEKIDAALTAASILFGGGNSGQVISFYRVQVAENACRLGSKS
ncbi:hypothetical protein ACQR16_23175 [Bradyrhizobium oligotrophicum]|uniref:hypothetical protein n=1 Tax=Bradyrhizobium oligotrophicum TaxID=44255 RepID=UPI003EBB338C